MKSLDQQIRYGLFDTDTEHWLITTRGAPRLYRIKRNATAAAFLHDIETRQPSGRTIVKIFEHSKIMS